MNLTEISLPSTQYLTEAFRSNTEGFSLDDLLLIAHTFLSEAKNNKSRSVPIGTLNNATEGVVFVEASCYASMTAPKIQHLPKLQAKVDEFKASKKANKMQPYGPNDNAFVGGGPISNMMPGLRHAHVTRDLSIVYALSGANPTVITLYGIFSHAETGTGTPGKPDRQKSFAKFIKNQ
jgi:hypothetical protein